MMTTESLFDKVWKLFDGNPNRDALKGTVYDLCFYTVEIRKLQDIIEAEGSVIDTPRGDKTSPAATLLHTYMTDKNACLKTLLPVMKSHVSKDELMDFLSA